MGPEMERGRALARGARIYDGPDEVHRMVVARRELARYRLRIVLVERSDDVGSGATKANSGIVHGAYSSPHGTLKATMCAAGARMVPRLDGELAFGYRRTGALVLAFSPPERRDRASRRDAASSSA